jgi:methionine synthase II (cobalamin-independent)
VEESSVEAVSEVLNCWKEDEIEESEDKAADDALREVLKAPVELGISELVDTDDERSMMEVPIDELEDNGADSEAEELAD